VSLDEHQHEHDEHGGPGAHRHHHHHHHGGHLDGGDGGSALRPRFFIAALIVAFAITAACVVKVRAGEATVVTRFGNPARVLLQPGPALRLPLPFEATVPVDLRIRTTSSGLQDVGTRDGLRIIVQAFVIWQVQPDGDDIKRFMRAVQNQPDEAARQIRTFVGSLLQTSTAEYDLSDLVNTDASKVRLNDLESHLQDQISQQLLATYGVRVIQVGIERLTLPAVTLEATVERMRAERETVATERTAVGRREAAEIRSTADRDARIIRANATVKAADIEAQSKVQAARTYGQAYASAPELYSMLRNIDTLSTIITPGSKVILRTDAAPFRALVDGPPTPGSGVRRGP